MDLKCASRPPSEITAEAGANHGDDPQRPQRLQGFRVREALVDVQADEEQVRTSNPGLLGADDTGCGAVDVLSMQRQQRRYVARPVQTRFDH